MGFGRCISLGVRSYVQVLLNRDNCIPVELTKLR